MAPALSQREPEARSAMRVRQETDWYRVFKRDDSIDVLARAVRSGTAQDGATEEMKGCADQTWGGLDRRRRRDEVREGLQTFPTGSTL
jgi:hypothetical protein